MKKENLNETAKGHDFFKGYFTRYTDSNGVEITEYSRGFWEINGDHYKLENDEFIKLETPKPNRSKSRYKSVTFPKVHRRFC